MSLTSLILLASAALPQKSLEVPFKVGDDAIVVDAVVNGRPVSLMFDTGFSGSVVVDNSVNLGTPTGTMTLRDFVGEFQAPTIKIKTLTMGDFKADTKDMEAVQQRRSNMSFSYNTYCVGIMGFDVIADHVTEINFEKKRFIFHPNTTDISKRVPDNKRTFLAKLLPKGADSMEIAVEANNGKKMTLALDTGNAFYATTHKEVLERVGMWPSGKEAQFMKASFVASGEVSSWDIRMKDMKIFGVPVTESIWNIIDLPSSSADHDGTVGFGFLKNFNITIDMSRRRVWLENWTGKVANEVKADLGISAFPWERNQNRVTVFRVSKGSPAEKAGVKVGDILLSIDGQELLDTDVRRIMRLMEGDKGVPAKIVLSRKGELIRMEIPRDYLVNEALTVAPKTPQ